MFRIDRLVAAYDGMECHLKDSSHAPSHMYLVSRTFFRLSELPIWRRHGRIASNAGFV